MNDTLLTAEQLAPLEALFGASYPQTLREMATSVYAALLERASTLPEHPGRAQRLARLALDITNRLSRDFGGNGLYVPQAMTFHLTARNREMYALHDNKRWTYKTLGKKYDLSESQVRNIIAACMEDELAERQHGLPGFDESA